jgi:hypothetical protein
MATALDMLNIFKAMNITDIAEEVLNKTSPVALEANKDQLFDGKLSTGEDISPTYLEDPYFKSKESAQRYSDWKDAITPNNRRKKGVPNLFINGAFYQSIEVQAKGGGLLYHSSFYAASDIESKFSDNVYGLGGEYRDEYLDNNLVPKWQQRIESETGLMFK